MQLDLDQAIIRRTRPRSDFFASVINNCGGDSQNDKFACGNQSYRSVNLRFRHGSDRSLFWNDLFSQQFCHSDEIALKQFLPPRPRARRTSRHATNRTSRFTQPCFLINPAQCGGRRAGPTTHYHLARLAQNLDQFPHSRAVFLPFVFRKQIVGLNARMQKTRVVSLGPETPTAIDAICDPTTMFDAGELFHFVSVQMDRRLASRPFNNLKPSAGKQDRRMVGGCAVGVTQIFRQVVPGGERRGGSRRQVFHRIEIVGVQGDGDVVALAIEHALDTLGANEAAEATMRVRSRSLTVVSPNADSR